MTDWVRKDSCLSKAYQKALLLSWYQPSLGPGTEQCMAKPWVLLSLHCCRVVITEVGRIHKS